MTNEFDLPTLPNAQAAESARMSDDQSLIKARYCRSILKVAAISTDQEARILLNGLATEKPTSDTSAPMAQAERAALASIRELAGISMGGTRPKAPASGCGPDEQSSCG
jgi:hypothetical protein